MNKNSDSTEFDNALWTRGLMFEPKFFDINYEKKYENNVSSVYK